MRLSPSFVAMALALAAAPAVLACPPLVIGNMTALESNLVAWNTAMDTYITGDLAHPDAAFKATAQLSLSINSTATSLVEAPYWDDGDSKRVFELYGTLGGNVTAVADKLQQNMDAFVKAKATGFLGDALLPIESACDGFAETLASKAGPSYVDGIKKVAASIDTSIDATLKSLNPSDASPEAAVPAETDLSAQTNSKSSSNVKAAGEGDMMVDASSSGKGSAKATSSTDGGESQVKTSSNGSSSSKVAASGDSPISVIAKGSGSSSASASAHSTQKEKRSEAPRFVYRRRSLAASDNTDALLYARKHKPTSMEEANPVNPQSLGNDKTLGGTTEEGGGEQVDDASTHGQGTGSSMMSSDNVANLQGLSQEDLMKLQELQGGKTLPTSTDTGGALPDDTPPPKKGKASSGDKHFSHSSHAQKVADTKQHHQEIQAQHDAKREATKEHHAQLRAQHKNNQTQKHHNKKGHGKDSGSVESITGGGDPVVGGGLPVGTDPDVPVTTDQLPYKQGGLSLTNGGGGGGEVSGKLPGKHDAGGGKHAASVNSMKGMEGEVGGAGGAGGAGGMGGSGVGGAGGQGGSGDQGGITGADGLGDEVAENPLKKKGNSKTLPIETSLNTEMAP